MKARNLSKRVLVTLLCVTVLLGFLSSVDAKAASSAINLKRNSITLQVGATTTIPLKRAKGVTVKKIAYSSNNRSIVSVTSKGKIKAKKLGKVYVYVTVKYVQNKKAYTTKLKTMIVVKACPHKNFITVKYIKPSCTKTGKKQIKCKQCGCVKTSILKATGHKYDKGVVIKKPTCTATGTKVYTCTICKSKKSERISALGHDYTKEYVVDEMPTCTVDGSMSYHCNRCGNKKNSTPIEAVGHDYGDWVVTKEPTCTEAGEKQRVCKWCNNVEIVSIAVADHSWGPTHIVKSATCTSEGEESYTCIKCGYTETKIVEKADHDWTELTAKRVKPTCKTIGSATYTCNICHKTKDVELPKLNHDYEWAVKVAPTFWETGVKLKKCSSCGLEDTSTYTCMDSVRYVKSEESKSFSAYSGCMIDFRDLENTYNYVESISKSRANTDFYGGNFSISTDILVKSNSDTKKNESIHFSISESYDQRILNTSYHDYTTGKNVYFKFDLGNPNAFDEVLNNPAVLTKYGSSVVSDLKEHKDKLWAYSSNRDNYSYYIDVRLLSAIVTYMGKDVLGYTPGNCIVDIGNNVNSTSVPSINLYKIVK